MDYGYDTRDHEQVHRDEDRLRERLREVERELRNARMLFWCAVRASGGELRIHDSIMMHAPSDPILQRDDDIANSQTIWRAR